MDPMQLAQSKFLHSLVMGSPNFQNVHLLDLIVEAKEDINGGEFWL